MNLDQLKTQVRLHPSPAELLCELICQHTTTHSMEVGCQAYSRLGVGVNVTVTDWRLKQLIYSHVSQKLLYACPVKNILERMKLLNVIWNITVSPPGDELDKSYECMLGFLSN
jgi:hypothetical protein